MAEAAGALKTTPQEVVQDEGPDIDIEAAAPDVVYVRRMIRGLSGGIQVVRGDDIHSHRGRRGLSEGSRQEDRCSRQSYEGIRLQSQLAKG